MYTPPNFQRFVRYETIDGRPLWSHSYEVYNNNNNYVDSKASCWLPVDIIIKRIDGDSITYMKKTHQYGLLPADNLEVIEAIVNLRNNPVPK
jgi:hypothetical protein